MMETEQEKTERLRAFDRDAYLAALERPVFHAEGRTITGRLLSADQWFQLEARLEQQRAAQLSPRAMLALAHDIIRVMFPPATAPAWWRFGSRLRAWRERRRSPDVLTLVRAMPWGGQIAVAAHFSQVQARAQTGERLDDATEPQPPNARETTGDGARSPRRTAPVKNASDRPARTSGSPRASSSRSSTSTTPASTTARTGARARPTG